jgi:hypothetical protein
MAWIAFASVPTILVVMLAMGQLEARLLPPNPDPNADLDRIRADVGLRAEPDTRADTGARPSADPRADTGARPSADPRADTGARPSADPQADTGARAGVGRRAEPPAGRADAALRWEVVVGRIDGREGART